MKKKYSFVKRLKSRIFLIAGVAIVMVGFVSVFFSSSKNDLRALHGGPLDQPANSYSPEIERKKQLEANKAETRKVRKENIRQKEEHKKKCVPLENNYINACKSASVAKEGFDELMKTLAKSEGEAARTVQIASQHAQTALDKKWQDELAAAQKLDQEQCHDLIQIGDCTFKKAPDCENIKEKFLDWEDDYTEENMQERAYINERIQHWEDVMSRESMIINNPLASQEEKKEAQEIYDQAQQLKLKNEGYLQIFKRVWDEDVTAMFSLAEKNYNACLAGSP